MEHLKGLTALEGINKTGSQENISLTLISKTDRDCSDVTVMSTDARPGTLHQQLLSMKPQDEGQSLHAVRAYSSEDDKATLNTFTYGKSWHEMPSATKADGADILEGLSKETKDAELFTESSLSEFFSLCRPRFVQSTSPERFAIYRRLYERVKGTEDIECVVVRHPAGGALVCLADTDVAPKNTLTKMTGLLAARGLNVMRLQLDLVRDPSNYVGDKPSAVSIIRALVRPTEADASTPEKPRFSLENIEEGKEWQELIGDLRRIKYLDKATVNLALKEWHGLGMQRAEILTAFWALLHGPLSKLQPFQGVTNLKAVIAKPIHVKYATEVADLFLARFNPRQTMSADAFAKESSALRERINVMQDEAARILLSKMVDAVELTLRTNLFYQKRSALALRIEPSLLVAPGQPMPFGVFFIHGRGFNGFHNRFQNIARGGLRLVTPSSPEQLSKELSNCYDEVYGLSHAQELKNKDIPEGGSKAVVLVDVTQTSSSERYLTLRTSVKAFTNALLDLTQSSEDRSHCMVDYLGFPELIYLGPDEQVVPEDINWIIGQAAKRGYPIPAAFMSSKPAAGINHKQYGVTSEGVVVFLDVALREQGIQPDKQPFTVKITGGPDGDVAGNLMRILFRDYGENARIVGVSDGSGCAEDPKGLPQAELMRLFNAGLPIAEIDSSKLSPAGQLHDLRHQDRADGHYAGTSRSD